MDWLCCCFKKNNRNLSADNFTIDSIHTTSPLFYQPPPNADPNAPPPTAFAAIGSKVSKPAPGVAAPTNGVLSC